MTLENTNNNGAVQKRSAVGATPSMQQYFALKADYPDALLFFRMGDFYELFFEDAQAAATALNIALTKRGQHQGEPVPMCGVPAHTHEAYLQNLIRKGFRVAICEQMESPAKAKKRGSKAVVKRDVVRLVTPGTLSEETLLSPHQSNYLAACYHIDQKNTAIAWLDMSTGAFHVATTPDVAGWLARIAPTEILVQDEHADNEIFSDLCITPLSTSSFHVVPAQKRLLSHYNVKTLDAYGTFSQAQVSALGAVLEYVSYTQKGCMPYIGIPKVLITKDYLHIDSSTRKNLELSQTLSGERKGSLLEEIDHTLTGLGARLLADRLQAPLTNPDAIHARLDGVAYFVRHLDERTYVLENVRRIADLERALNRIVLSRGGPRDLKSIQTGLAHVRDLYTYFQRTENTAGQLPVLLQNAVNTFSGHSELVDKISEKLCADDLPISSKEGNFIIAGADAVLDEMRQLRDNSRRIILELEVRYKQVTNVNSLKIKFNNILGYFIETPVQHGDTLMQIELFRHRQTLANCMRFSTVELSELERRILHARDSALLREVEIFEELCIAVKAHAAHILAAAQGVAEIDIAVSFAKQAEQKKWVRPTVDTSRNFTICAGRHPVVEASLKNTSFIPNDCDLTEKPVWLLTGPNMAGKSTFLRQNALIAIMAQIGCFVPAESAHIGIVDQLFSRVGASDDLARGRSTFMVEMVETAAILNQAGQNALVILDEIGRGTSTYDGLSIAWATLEHMHNVNKCRTLFATHYHELTVLPETLVGVVNASVKVREWNGDIIFMHQVVKGAADRSYGVQVARLAGVPEQVIKRAKVLLDTFENHKKQQDQQIPLPLFAAKESLNNLEVQDPKIEFYTNQIEPYIQNLDPDSLSPKEALNIVYKIKEFFKEK